MIEKLIKKIVNFWDPIPCHTRKVANNNNNKKQQNFHDPNPQKE